MRRRAAVLAVVLAFLVGLAPVPAVAQSPPDGSISVTPSCGPVNSGVAVSVDGSGWAAGAVVDFEFEGNYQSSHRVEPDGTFSISYKFVPTESRYYDFEVRYSNANFGPHAGYSAPCRNPRIVLTPDCGSPARATEVTVEGFDFPPSWDVRVIWDQGGSGEREDGTGSDDAGYFKHTFVDLITTAERSYVVFADTYGFYGIAERARYRVPCPPPPTGSTTSTSTTTTSKQTTTTATTTTTTTTIPPPTPGAALVVDPPLGRTGFVTTARGSGFTPGLVNLTWAPGIGTTTAVAGPDGTFQVGVLVMPNDVLGPRTLVATGAVTTATAAFLVVPNTMKPAGSDVVQIVRLRRYLHR